MLNIYTVSFFGHRAIYDNIISIENKLENIVRDLLWSKEYVEFLVGRNGDFDRIVSSTICRCKREYRDDNSAHILVLPYLTAEYRNNEEYFEDYYDEIEISEKASGGHYKAAFQARNRDMVDRSDLVVFYIDHFSGGAYQTYRYTLEQEKEIINLADIADDANA